MFSYVSAEDRVPGSGRTAESIRWLEEAAGTDEAGDGGKSHCAVAGRNDKIYASIQEAAVVRLAATVFKTVVSRNAG